MNSSALGFMKEIAESSARKLDEVEYSSSTSLSLSIASFNMLQDVNHSSKSTLDRLERIEDILLSTLGKRKSTDDVRKGVSASDHSNSSDELQSDRPRKKKSQRFCCTDYPPCQLSFTRSEHLARHIM
jgi:hypothetical protein